MNPFETLNRARKVAKLLAAIPHGRTAAEVKTIAYWLAKRDQAWNDELAARVGVKSPSPETWAELVAAARARTPLDEFEAEIARVAS
ncbi:MAG TPA: hypothetical protein VFU97_24270 [Xanthobacteraceae bacterium]|nr:hypothetical protein [Xanthobacteraceae bacterium]